MGPQFLEVVLVDLFIRGEKQHLVACVREVAPNEMTTMG